MLKTMHIYNFIRDRILVPTILKMFELKEGDRVLDVGCGEGIIAIELAKKGALVTGIDTDSNSLQLARMNHPHKNITYVNCDAIHCDFNYEFDVCLLSLVLNEIEDLKDIFFRIRNISRSILIIIPHPCFQFNHSQWLSMKSLSFDNKIMSYEVDRYSDYNSFEKMLPNGRTVREYHRPLSEYCNHLIMNGFLIDRIEEPTLSREDSEYGHPLFNHAYFLPKFVFILARRSSYES